MKSLSNANYDNIFRFIDDLNAINDRNEFNNHYNEIFPLELILKKENTSHTETAFLNPLIWMFCSRKANNPINKIHERYLIVTNDKNSNFEDLLKSITKSMCIKRNFK